MEALAKSLPIIIYILLIGLIIIGIIIGIKLIITMNKVEKVVDNIEGKVNSLNSLFHVIDSITTGISGAYDRVVDGITKLVEKIFIGKRKESEDEDYE